MVLAERGGATTASAELARNGRRSRGPSPNGRATPDSSSDDENVVPFPAEKIRVGRDYQAICPELEPIEERQPDLIADRALLVWSPTLDIADNKLDEYITVAKEKYGYNGEQALGMLFWHKHDLDRAVLDLANFTPFPDEWTVEDKVLFDQAFQFHGKSFHRIRQMLPDKSIASLVKYYYSWKKTRARSSQMDRTAATQKRDGSPDRASDRASDDRESDADEKVQTNKQQISALKRKNSDSIEDLRPGEMTSKINSRWTNDELLMAVQGVRKYGKDFQAIAETIGTKTETHVRTFWASYKRRYNLDSVLREFEAERGGGGSGPSSSVTLPTSPASGANIDNLPNQDINNGHGLTANGNGDDASEMGGSSSTTGAAGGAIGRSNSPIVIKDDKMEVDSEGCALGSIAEQGGAPTTPSKPTSKSTK